MILTTCAACAAPLAHDAPRCIRCKMRYCDQEDRDTILSANNYADLLVDLGRFEEARLFTRKTIPVARRILGESHDYTFTLRKIHAEALYKDASSTHDDLREAVTTLEEIERSARRVFGGAHPRVPAIEKSLARSRAKLRARETPPSHA